MGSLNADLYELWKSGKVYLPWIGSAYSDAGQALRSLPSAEAIFIMPGSDDESPISSAWETLLNTYQYILDESCINVLDTGDALLDVVDLYTDSDLMSADEIAALQEDIENHAESSDDTAGEEDPSLPPPPEPIPRPDDPINYGADPRDPSASHQDPAVNHGEEME